jgi:hypothetical protein
MITVPQMSKIHLISGFYRNRNFKVMLNGVGHQVARCPTLGLLQLCESIRTLAIIFLASRGFTPQRKCVFQAREVIGAGNYAPTGSRPHN